jgi:hypothetical protein
MILFRSTDWDKGLSPEEMQNIMAKTMAWFDELARQGKLKAAQPLHDEGKIVSGRKTRTVADGPFAESKETIAGYLLVRVDSIEEAVEIAKGWPLLDVGATVEVRPVAAECPSFERLGVHMAHVAA